MSNHFHFVLYGTLAECRRFAQEYKRRCAMRMRLNSYIIDGLGMILPSCYVDSRAVEQVFRHPSRLMMSLARKVENDVEILLGVADHVSMTEQEILTQIVDLIRKEFRKSSFRPGAKLPKTHAVS